MATKKPLVIYSGSIEELRAGDTLGGAADVVGPASATDNAITRFDGTTGKVIQNSSITLDDDGNLIGVNAISFDTTPSTVPTDDGTLFWNADLGSLSYVMAGGDVVQEIGENLYIYARASSAVTKGQVVMFTGAVGASGTPTCAPATSVSDGSYIIGIAAESIALNEFGFIQTFGVLKPLNTSAFSIGDILWYDPTVTGGLTATKPEAPNVKVQVAAVVASGSGGALLIRVTAGSEFGGTDSNVKFNTLASGNIILYDADLSVWKNITINGTTNEVTVTSTKDGITISLPDTISASITGNAATVTNGVYTTDTGTVTNTMLAGSIANNKLANSSITINGTATALGGSINVGTVTSVTATSPVASTGGATPVISMTQASGSVNGWLSSTDWTTFNNKTSNTGTVTSVALSLPTGLTVSGSPITTNGTLTVTFTAGYSIPTNTKQSNWDTAFGWGNHASAGYLTSAAIGVSVQAYDVDIPTVSASQAEMEAGTETALRSMSPLRIKQAITALAGSGGGFSNMQIITSSTTWNVPSGISKARITVVGGGGGGSGNKTPSVDSGAWGGNGGVAITEISGLSGSYTVTIGAGGAGGSGGSGTSTGGNGGNSSFGSIASATGGSGASGTTVGANGTGTVSSGTVIRQSAGSYGLPTQVQGKHQNGSNNGGGSSALAYSVSAAFGAGIGGASANTISNSAFTGGGGIGGVVIIEY